MHACTKGKPELKVVLCSPYLEPFGLLFVLLLLVLDFCGLPEAGSPPSKSSLSLKAVRTICSLAEREAACLCVQV